MNNYGIFFSLDDLVVRLPMNPEELPDNLNSDNAEYNVLGIGTVTVPRTPLPREITINSYFPARVDSSVLTPNEFWEPELYIQFFREAMQNKYVLTYTPVRYLENGEAFDTSDSGFKCLVQAFNVTERGGETGDFYYELQIREYRDYSPMEVEVVEEKSTKKKKATKKKTRSSDKIGLGSVVIANGKYYYTSYGDKPYGTANGIRCIVNHIAPKSRPYPYHIARESGGDLGWTKLSCLTATKDGKKVKTPTTKKTATKPSGANNTTTKTSSPASTSKRKHGGGNAREIDKHGGGNARKFGTNKKNALDVLHDTVQFVENPIVTVKTTVKFITETINEAARRAQQRAKYTPKGGKKGGNNKGGKR